MRILHVTPGAGDGRDCENCMRDSSLIWALRQAGHEVEPITLYLPQRADRDEERHDGPIFFGGINVYLQQRSWLFRYTPRWLDKLLDAPALLRWASRKSHMTDPTDVAETLISMLAGEHGNQRKELERLARHCKTLPRPDAIVLSNPMLCGVASRLRRDLGAPVVCLLQDEDYFLDDLGPELSARAWAEVGRRARELDGCIAVSRYYGELMAERLGLAPEQWHVVHSAIYTGDLDTLLARPVEPGPPTLAYVSPLTLRGGADRLLEAFARLAPRHDQLRLALVGIKVVDDAFVAQLRERVAELGLGDRVDVLLDLDRTRRLDVLRRARAVAAPTRRGEAFGRFVLEAMAVGAPVVLPAHGAFVELVESTGGGVLHPPEDADALVAALDRLLTDDGHHATLSGAGRAAVRERFDLARFAEDVAGVLEGIRSGGPVVV